MPYSLYRYKRSHYKQIWVKKEIWFKLKEEADKKGMSIPGLLKYILECNKRASVSIQEVNKEIERLKNIKQLCEFILNSHNGRRMFNIVSRTWNPVSGCYHDCKYCWARKYALQKLKYTKRYSKGFIPQLNTKEFKVKFNEEFVFVTDMGDLFGNWVKKEWILKVIEHIKNFPRSYFLFLTKNPRRYHEFIDKFPENAILGATIETNKDELYLKHFISKAPLPSDRYEAMASLNWKYKFIAIEPILDFDLEAFVKWIREINPIMVYIGYDNYNNKLPEPSQKKTLALIDKLSEFTLVIRKTIRPAWNEGMLKYLPSQNVSS